MDSGAALIKRQGEWKCQGKQDSASQTYCLHSRPQGWRNFLIRIKVVLEFPYNKIYLCLGALKHSIEETPLALLTQRLCGSHLKGLVSS